MLRGAIKCLAASLLNTRNNTVQSHDSDWVPGVGSTGTKLRSFFKIVLLVSAATICIILGTTYVFTYGYYVQFSFAALTGFALAIPFVLTVAANRSRVTLRIAMLLTLLVLFVSIVMVWHANDRHAYMERMLKVVKRTKQKNREIQEQQISQPKEAGRHQ